MIATMSESWRKAIALVYGGLCHGLFVAGVAMMIWQMYFGMSRSFGTLAAPWSHAANLLLIAQFPLAHSLLLTGRGRGALAWLAPAQHRTRHGAHQLCDRGFAANAAFVFPVVAERHHLVAGGRWHARSYSARSISPAGCCSPKPSGMRGSDYRRAPSVGSGSTATGGLHYPPMPQTGLFRYSRQPIYFAFTLTVWTVPVWTPDQLVIAVTLTAYCLIGPLFKEKRFSLMFGASFDDYRRGLSYFIPMARAAIRNDLSIYDRYAEHWWDGSVRWLRTLQNLVPARLAHFDSLIDWRSKQVLDLGCGGGFMAEALAQRGAAVHAIDPATEAIAIAKRHAADYGLAIKYQTGVGESLPFADVSLDAVVCVDVLEHVADLDRVIAEVHRVLRPGGVFLFDTINRTWLARLVVVHLAEDVLRLLPRGTHDPAKFIRPQELETALKRIGFKTFPPVGLGPRGLSHRLDFKFGRLPVTSIMYMSHAIKT